MGKKKEARRESRKAARKLADQLIRAGVVAARSYDAAMSGPRRQGFAGRGTSANAEIGGALRTLRDRARSMVRNTAHGHAIVDVMVRHVVGAGITPTWNTGSDAADRRIGLLYEEWTTRCDIEGELDFYAMQALWVRSMVEGGEALCRFVDRPYAEDPRTPLRLQLLEGDHIDGSRDGTTINGAIGNERTRLGIALGDWSERRAYWLFDNHPGEQVYSWTAAGYTSRRVPRDQVVHLYRPMRIGQIRGVTWLAPVLMSAKDLAELMQNTLVKTGVEAAFAGFIIDQGGGPVNMGAAVSASSTDNEQEMMPEPGMLMRLKGQDIKFAEPKTSTQFESISIATLQAMAAGTGHTYDQITGDLRQANYSSLRAGKIEHRRLVEQVQWHDVIPRLNRITACFIDRCILAGTLRPRADGYPHDWVPPANEPIDPLKDLEADIAAVRAGRMAPQEFITQWGRDWKKVVTDTVAFWKFADANGMALDIDPRRPVAGPGVPKQYPTSEPKSPNADGSGGDGTGDGGGDGNSGDASSTPP